MPTDSLGFIDRDREPSDSHPAETSTRGWPQPDQILRSVLAAVSVAAIGAVVIVAILRVRYPFELEWMEGGVVAHVRVVLSGQPLYRAPSLDFTPFIYTPFYYQVCAALSPVLGVGFLPARLVSILAVAGSLALIASFVHRESGDRLAALAAAGLFAATYELTGFWFDIARVDSLFLLLILAGTWLARFPTSRLSALGSGVLLFLAFWTKQTGLVLAAPALVFALVSNWRRGLFSTGAFALPVIAAVLGMHYVSDGWFGYYIFGAPAQHEILWDRAPELALSFFWNPVAVPMLLAGLAIVSDALHAQGRRVWLLYMLLTGCALGTSYSSLLHRDGFVNVLMPGYAVLSMMAGLGYAWVSRQTVSRSSCRLRILRGFSAGGLVMGFLALAYDVRRAVPSAADVSAAQQMIDGLKTAPGPILLLSSGNYGTMAGHGEVNAHAMALADIFKTRDQNTMEHVRSEILQAIREKHYRGIVIDRGWDVLPPEFAAEVRTRYRLASKLFPASAPNDGWPRNGFHTRPDELWVPQ